MAVMFFGSLHRELCGRGGHTAAAVRDFAAVQSAVHGSFRRKGERRAVVSRGSAVGPGGAVIFAVLPLVRQAG